MPLQFEPNPLLMEEIPGTLDEMLARVDKLFHCMNGPPMAYFDIPLYDNRGRTPDDLAMKYDFDYAKVERQVYASLAWRSTQARDPSVERALVGRLLDALLAARQDIDANGGTPLLFWRRLPEIVDNEEAPGCKIRCRLAVPGFSFMRYQVLEGEMIPLV